MSGLRTDIIAAVFLAVVNIAAFILYGIDKSRARNGKWRISEKTLLGMAVIGGSIGALFGMHVFHHKTKHWYFRYGLPVILMIQVLLAFFICRRA